jgi:hypothetical protein
MILLDGLSASFLIIGSVFFLAGTVGMLRFPDAHARLHALTKADKPRSRLHRPWHRRQRRLALPHPEAGVDLVPRRRREHNSLSDDRERGLAAPPACGASRCLTRPSTSSWS